MGVTPDTTGAAVGEDRLARAERTHLRYVPEAAPECLTRALAVGSALHDSVAIKDMPWACSSITRERAS